MQLNIFADLCTNTCLKAIELLCLRFNNIGILCCLWSGTCRNVHVCAVTIVMGTCSAKIDKQLHKFVSRLAKRLVTDSQCAVRVPAVCVY